MKKKISKQVAHRECNDTVAMPPEFDRIRKNLDKLRTMFL